MRDHYNEVLMQSWVKRFREIFENDTYTPIQVTTIKEYQDIIGKTYICLKKIGLHHLRNTDFFLNFSPVL